jgi:hypothetical protein
MLDWDEMLDTRCIFDDCSFSLFTPTYCTVQYLGKSWTGNKKQGTYMVQLPWRYLPNAGQGRNAGHSMHFRRLLINPRGVLLRPQQNRSMSQHNHSKICRCRSRIAATAAKFLCYGRGRIGGRRVHFLKIDQIGPKLWLPPIIRLF